MNYLFIFENGDTFKVKQSDFKRAIWEVGKYTGVCGEHNNILKKSLNGFDNNDIAGIVELFNHFNNFYDSRISEIYEVKEQIFGEIEGD